MTRRKQRSRQNVHAALERKRARRRREAISTYLVIALVAGAFLYSIYTYVVHHP